MQLSLDFNMLWQLANSKPLLKKEFYFFLISSDEFLHIHRG